MLENVRGLLDPAFSEYRAHLECQLSRLGYHSHWKLLQSSEFGVSQLRPRVVLVAIRDALNVKFQWPQPSTSQPPSIGDLLYDLMAANGWQGARDWQERATSIAPTLVGGSKKHGGPDLEPTRARQTWATLGVDGSGVWDDAPPQSFVGYPRLTTKMAARVQGFPDEWDFMGGKTAVYRQIGNAFPPPVAFAVGRQIRMSLEQAVLGVQPALL
jgi:DNA (cytosine-5)-methyltransferase 1